MAFLTGEARDEEGPHEFPCERMTDHETAEADQIEIIIFDSLMRGEGIVDEAGADAGHFVGDDACADATAADRHSTLHFSGGNGTRQRHDEIRVVIRWRELEIAIINDLRTGLTQHHSKILLQLMATMIGSDAHDLGGLDGKALIESQTGFHRGFQAMASA